MRRTFSFPKSPSLVLLVLCGVAMLSSCASIHQMRTESERWVVVAPLSRPYADVWKAVMLALDGVSLATVDRDRGFVQSHWITGWGEKKFGALAGLGSGGSWKRRARCSVWLHPGGNGTAIKIRWDVEEKPPGGAMAYRWVRVAPEPEQGRELLDQIQRQLGNLKNSAP